MHIVEVDEHLDYGKFYSHGHDTASWGHQTWEILHGLADNYPCPPCKPVFQTLMSGSHDVVNVNLGKPIHDPKRFREFVALVHEAAHKADMTPHRKRHIVHE